MTKFQKIGLTVLIVIGIGWLVKSCAARSRPGYGLAKALKDQGLGISEIKVNESSSWFDEVNVTGYRLRLKVIRLDKSAVYDQYFKMFSEAASGGSSRMKAKMEGEAVSVMFHEPFMIWVLEEPSPGRVRAAAEGHLGEVTEIRFEKER